MDLILASASPRRIELLRTITENFEIYPSNADETLPEGIAAAEAVELLAQCKCHQTFAEHPQATVIGADTVVAVDGCILGKPADRADAAHMLRMLSGKTHIVYTGVCIRSPKRETVFVEHTSVRFYPLDESAITWYLDTGEPFDKAGAYGIQQKGALLVQGIEGDYFNVMGFPLARIARELIPHHAT